MVARERGAPPLNERFPEQAALLARRVGESRGVLRLVVGLDSGIDADRALGLGPNWEELYATAADAVAEEFLERHAQFLRPTDGASVQRIEDMPYLVVRASDAAVHAFLADDAVLSLNSESGGEAMLNEATQRIGATVAHGQGFTGNGYAIAVIDQGVDTSHAMFSGRLIGEACFSTSYPGVGTLCSGGATWGSTAAGSGGQCVTPATLPNPLGSGTIATPGSVLCDDFHGSHVSAIAMGAMQQPKLPVPSPLMGVAHQASLVAINATSLVHQSHPNCRPGVGYCRLFLEGDVAAALNQVRAWRASKNIAAVNMSFGLSNVSSDWSGTSCDAHWPVLRDAVALLEQSGVVAVAAAGNYGGASDFALKIAPPACLSKVGGVSSTFKSSDALIHQSDGPPLTRQSARPNYAGNLSFLAPGGQARWYTTPVDACVEFTHYDGIWSAWPDPACGYVRLPGTSMAAPHVAGAVAVLRSRFPSATATGIQAQLRRTGVPIDLSIYAPVVVPRINLAAAIKPPPAPSGAPATPVAIRACWGLYEVSWSAVSGPVSEYQLEVSNGSSSWLGYVGPGQTAWIQSPATVRARACNAVSCGSWSASRQLVSFSGCP